MGRGILCAAVLLLSAFTAGAQIETLIVDREGRYCLVVNVGSDTYVTLSDTGDIMDVDTRGEVEYNRSIFDYLDGKIKSAGGVRFDYYHSVFDYQNGKVKKIGNVSFEYWNDFDEWRNGKLKSVGNKKIEYFDNFTIDDAKKGKPKSIAGIQLDFFGENSISDYPGLLRSIGPKTYTYSNRGRDRRPEMNGQRNFETNGIRVKVVERMDRDYYR